MGLFKWMRNHPEEMQGVTLGITILGGLLGAGDKALALAALLNSVPGRVDHLKAAIEKIDRQADSLEVYREAPADGSVAPATKREWRVDFTADELDALDDWLDLQAQSTRKLKKLAKRVIGK